MKGGILNMKKLLAFVLALSLLCMGGVALADGETLVIYSARNERLNNIVIPAFEAKTGIKVEYVEISTGKALAQMQAENGVQSAVFENGALRIEYAAGCAYLDGEELHLTPIEYKLLCLLSQNAGKVLTHTFITQKIWGSSWENDIASLRVFMATLRKKLEKNGEQTQYIQTHIGVGYRMLKVE